MIINGDALQVLKGMPENLAHCMVTSPPYYGLRKYGTPPVVFGGDLACEHEWGEVHPPGFRESDTNPGELQSEGNKNREQLTSEVCSKCGAWRGELGLEPTPEMYVQHLVEIFREVRRVLRNDGTFWLNIGDSYASGKGSCFNPGGNEHSLQDDCKQSGGIPTKRPNISDVKEWGMKPKDLIGIPWMLAFALRSDGWYLRADLPWIKRNSMPSSVKDRPASSIEHVFLFSKSKKYYYDYVAVMQPSSDSYNNDKRQRGVLRQCVNPNSKYPDEGQFKKQDNVGNNTYTGFNARYVPNGEGLRFMRDSDFFFRTWQGILHNEDGEPMALVVNPKGYAGAHFACFPIKLVEPMILASTSEMGVCPVCNAPWKRIVSKEVVHHEKWFGEKQGARHSRGSAGESYDEPVGYNTDGWEPTCTCGIEPISKDRCGLPSLVIDPFAGSSATGVACRTLKRRYIGIELKEEYCNLGKTRMLEESKKEKVKPATKKQVADMFRWLHGGESKTRRKSKKEVTEASKERTDIHGATEGTPTRFFYENSESAEIRELEVQTGAPEVKPEIIFRRGSGDKERLQGLPGKTSVPEGSVDVPPPVNDSPVQQVWSESTVPDNSGSEVGILPGVPVKANGCVRAVYEPSMRVEYEESYNETTLHACITCKCGTKVWYGCGKQHHIRPKYCSSCTEIEIHKLLEHFPNLAKEDPKRFEAIIEEELYRIIPHG